MERLRMFHHDLHSIPELGFREFKTKRYILSILSSLDCIIYEVGQCGVIAYFDLGKEKSIGFRCELDGLPIHESVDNPVVSMHDGVMHACGHDVHMAILLAIAEFVNKSNSLYNVVLIFQSGEELHGGALEIINSGILQSFPINAIVGMHVWPGLPWGQVYSRDGVILAGSDEIDLEILGDSKHIADNCMKGNAMLCASELVLWCAHELNGKHRCNFGVLESGNARNVSSDYSLLKGSLRYFSEEDRAYCIEILEERMTWEDIKWETVSKLTITKCNSPIFNNINLYNSAMSCSSLSRCSLYYQSEDFGEYSMICPILYLLLGNGEKSISLHSSSFWVEDELVLCGFEYYKRLLGSSFL